eukprot:Phypoly_transcript_11543.p1 GENE.Phypoly_transcript_11543~~Phypoly_transcript_11543.p1  ORF type:complete len:346 (+),score=63.23 Phypoly_transcript_11543:137-1174(+)
MDTLTRMFNGLEDQHSLVREVYFRSKDNLDIAASFLLAMGFTLKEEKQVVDEVPALDSLHLGDESEETEVTQVTMKTPSTKQEATQPSQLPRPILQPQTYQLHPTSLLTSVTPIPVSAPIPIPSPTKARHPSNLESDWIHVRAPKPVPPPLHTQSATGLSDAICGPPPTSGSERSDAQNFVENLKNMGEYIKKNCKKIASVKELRYHDKIAQFMEVNKKKDDVLLAVYGPEDLLNDMDAEHEEIENEREELEKEKQKFEIEKRKFEEDRARFHCEVMRFNDYVQAEYKRLVSSHHDWLDSTRNLPRIPRYYEDIQTRLAGSTFKGMDMTFNLNGPNKEESKITEC